MKLFTRLGAPLITVVGMMGCASPHSGGQPQEQIGGSRVAETMRIGAALAQAGYVGTPMRHEGTALFVQAELDTTSVALQLSSGAPFDLQLDTSIARKASAALHMTHMLSSYWTFGPSNGQWAITNRLAIGATPLDALEAKVEPVPPPTSRAILGATALMSRGAIIDYATDTLYLLTPQNRPTPVQSVGDPLPTLRGVLERAGQYHTFLTLMDRAGLASFLDSTPPRTSRSDSIAWIGLRVQTLAISGVGAMPPNEMHLHLARQAVDQEVRGSIQRTVFAPTDAAFAKLPADTLRALQADTARLARLLRAHLYAGATIDTGAMRRLIRGAAHPGPGKSAFGFHVFGTQIDVDRLTSWEDGLVVARATIVQPNLKTAHGVAVAHGIDRVLGVFGESSPFVTTLVRQGYVEIPLHRREDGNGYVVWAKINNVPVQLTIDTGTGAEVVLDQQWATQSQLAPGSNYAVMLDSVNFGPVRVATADFSKSIQSVRLQGYRAPVGTLGAALLARYRARLDYATGMLYLRIP